MAMSLSRRQASKSPPRLAPGGREMCSCGQADQVVTLVPLVGISQGMSEAGDTAPDERARE